MCHSVRGLSGNHGVSVTLTHTPGCKHIQLSRQHVMAEESGSKPALLPQLLVNSGGGRVLHHVLLLLLPLVVHSTVVGLRSRTYYFNLT